MKLIVLLATTFLATGSLYAEAKLKIGQVDFQKALITVEEGRQTKQQLEDEANKLKSSLEKKADEIKKMEDDIKGLASSVLSEAAKMKKGQEYQEKVLAFRQEEQKNMDAMQAKEQEEVQKVFRKLRVITEDIAKTKKLDLVVEKNTSGLIFADGMTEITDEVIIEYDKRYKTAKK